MPMFEISGMAVRPSARPPVLLRLARLADRALQGGEVDGAGNDGIADDEAWRAVDLQRPGELVGQEHADAVERPERPAPPPARL